MNITELTKYMVNGREIWLTDLNKTDNDRLLFAMN